MIKVAAITEVSVEMIAAIGSGPVTVILDIDNTILAPTARTLDPRVIQHLMALKSQLNLLLCTNNMTSRQKEVAKILDLPILMQAMKPFTFRITPFIKSRGIPGSSLVVVGDQWVTDGCLANRLKCPVIMVDPIERDRHALTRLLRRLEKQWNP